MDIRTAIAAAAMLMFQCDAALAQTTTNRFSFVDRITGRAVSGTISGLREGTVFDDGLSATIDIAPDRSLIGAAAYRGGDITTREGKVTSASFLRFQSSDAAVDLLLGTTPLQGGYYPQVTNNVTGIQAYNDEVAPVFVPLASITNSWSFTDRLTGGLVTGTLTGLRDGTNDALGLVATVTMAPRQELLGSFAGQSGQFVVIDGVVTSGNALFNGTGPFFDLFMGTAGTLPFYPQVVDGASGAQAYDDQGGMIFGRIAAVPEPGSWSMLILGFGVVGMAMRRRPAAAIAG